MRNEKKGEVKGTSWGTQPRGTGKESGSMKDAQKE